MNCSTSWCKLNTAPIVFNPKSRFYDCCHERFSSSHKVLIHKQRMCPRSIGHCYNRSISYCFSPQIVLCSVFQLCKERFQIDPPVFSTLQCYEKRWRTMTPCNMMGYPMLEIFGSASPEVITTFYILRKAPQHL